MMRIITVLGNNSGRNAGDNAILGNLLDDFALVRNDIHFKIPTLNSRFIKNHFGHHNVEPIGLLPWNLALKNFGLPLYHAMTKTEMVFITDNILFDRKFHNPFVNYLKSIASFSSSCKKKGIPIVLYNASIGPIDFEVGRQALQKVLDASPLVITRDNNTKELIQNLKLSSPDIVVHADCALNTTPPSSLRLTEIIRKESLFTNPNGTIGLNINAYIDNWSKTGTMSRTDFVKIIAGTADKLIDKLGVDILFTVTQIMDLKITEECLQYIRKREKVHVVSNKDYTYQELAGLLERVEIHAGLRTHTLIFCAAVNTPMININAYPKSLGFLKTIGQENWTIDFENLTVDNLTDIMLNSWEKREQTRKEMAPLVEKEKKKSRDSVVLISELLDR